MVMRIVALMMLFGLVGAAPVRAGDPVPIRIGWQTSWATQGQMAAILKNSNLLELNGLKGEFKGFPYGGPLNEGALAGAVDVIFTADQPACMLLAKGAPWKIVGRLIYNRVGTLVPYGSKIKTVAELKDTTVGIPFGAAAHRETLKALKAAGLDPEKDLSIKNIGIYETLGVMRKDSKDWGEFAAFSSWDPPMAELESKKQARAVARGLVTSVIVMSDKFIKENPRSASDFLKAYVMAFQYYAGHQEGANRLFLDESGLKFSSKALDLAASVEPNLGAKMLADVDIRLSEKDIAAIQSGADFLFAQKLTPKHIRDIRVFVDQSHLGRAVKELSSLSEKDAPPVRVEQNSKGG